MTSTQEAAIMRFVNASFTMSDPSLPTGLCNTCRIGLSFFIKWKDNSETNNPPPKQLDIAPSYDNQVDQNYW